MLSSLGQMYCCLTREPHLPCSMLKEMPAEALDAENSLTGIETRPKEMLAVPIALALIALSVARLGSVESRESRGKRRSDSTGSQPSAPGLPPVSVRNRAARRGPVPSSSCLKKTKASVQG